MNLSFQELRCPKCQSELEQGTIQISQDVQMVKRCSKEHNPVCDFWMIIVIPDKEFDYSVQRTVKK